MGGGERDARERLQRAAIDLFRQQGFDLCTHPARQRGGLPLGAHRHDDWRAIDDGRELFDRDVTTSAEGGGVDASMRDNGIVRAAIAANFASAANCLDRAAFGDAPGDCALTPRFSVSVVRR